LFVVAVAGHPSLHTLTTKVAAERFLSLETLNHQNAALPTSSLRIAILIHKFLTTRLWGEANGPLLPFVQITFDDCSLKKAHATFLV
jgi:hypothetical protein